MPNSFEGCPISIAPEDWWGGLTDTVTRAVAWGIKAQLKSTLFNAQSEHNTGISQKERPLFISVYFPPLFCGILTESMRSWGWGEDGDTGVQDIQLDKETVVRCLAMRSRGHLMIAIPVIPDIYPVTPMDLGELLRQVPENGHHNLPSRYILEQRDPTGVCGFVPLSETNPKTPRRLLEVCRAMNERFA